MIGLGLSLTSAALRGREPRRNLLTFTEEFANAVWVKTGATATSDKISETAVTSPHFAGHAYTWTASTFTGTVEMKAAERGYGLLALAGTASSIGVNLATGAVVGSSSTGSVLNASTADAGDGWWRVRLSVNNVATGTLAFNVYASLDGVFANRSYAGVAGSGILVRRAQLEMGAEPTPYQRIGASY